MSTPKNAPTLSQTIDTSKFQNAGMNVKYTILDDVLFIAIPVSAEAIKAARPSGSGKSRTIGSTLGNVGIPAIAGLKLGVNAYVLNAALPAPTA